MSDQFGISTIFRNPTPIDKALEKIRFQAIKQKRATFKVDLEKSCAFQDSKTFSKIHCLTIPETTKRVTEYKKGKRLNKSLLGQNV